MLILPAIWSNSRTLNLLAGVTVVLASTGSYHCEADAGDTFPEFSLNGFGTLGAVYSSLDDADFRGNSFHPDGAGRSRPLEASVDSKLGLQLNAYMTPRWSAVLQAVVQYDYEGKYRPKVEWAYIDYQATPELTIRLGRVVIGAFMESETRLVGYTYPWVRPPQEIYEINPATNKDGIDIQYQFATGTVFNTLQISYGSIDKKVPGDAEVDVDEALNLQYIAESGPVTVKLGYSTSETQISQPDIAALFDGMAQFGAVVPGPAGEQALNNVNRYWGGASRFDIYSAGIKFQSDRWLLQAEWAGTDIRQPTFFSESNAWYLTVGYHFRQVTPYLTFARLQSDRRDTTEIPTGGLPPDLAQFATVLNSGLGELIDSVTPSQKRVAAGLRWNFNPNAALKLQFERIRTQAPAAGRLANLGPNFTPGESANIISVAMDFVF